MLPPGSRLRRRADFTTTLRRSRGVRADGLLLLHVAPPPAHQVGALAPAQVGFVVSRAVGPAVTRNLVRRRLRHLVAGHLGRVPAGTRVVVRALPATGGATFGELDAALGRALDRVLGPRPR